MKTGIVEFLPMIEGEQAFDAVIGEDTDHGYK
jgi:hypothetical protein